MGCDRMMAETANTRAAKAVYGTATISFNTLHGLSLTSLRQPSGRNFVADATADKHLAKSFGASFSSYHSRSTRNRVAVY